MLSKKMIDFTNQFYNLGLINVFEVPVIDKRTNEQEYIIFSISIEGSHFVASHVALTEKQQKSRKIAYVKERIDTDFSLNENLQCLYDSCINAILGSDFYEFSNN
jgi:hypothetical protein